MTTRSPLCLYDLYYCKENIIFLITQIINISSDSCPSFFSVHMQLIITLCWLLLRSGYHLSSFAHGFYPILEIFIIISLKYGNNFLHGFYSVSYFPNYFTKPYQTKDICYMKATFVHMIFSQNHQWRSQLFKGQCLKYVAQNSGWAIILFYYYYY